jgi:hypothetical protein
LCALRWQGRDRGSCAEPSSTQCQVDLRVSSPTTAVYSYLQIDSKGPPGAAKRWLPHTLACPGRSEISPPIFRRRLQLLQERRFCAVLSLSTLYPRHCLPDAPGRSSLARDGVSHRIASRLKYTHQMCPPLHGFSPSIPRIVIVERVYAELRDKNWRLPGSFHLLPISGCKGSPPQKNVGAHRQMVALGLAVPHKST